MILVDVYVPIMKQTFDVIVDETAHISVVIAELSEIICQRANWPRPKNIQNLVLCSLRTNHILPEDRYGNRQRQPADAGLTGGGTPDSARFSARRVDRPKICAVRRLFNNRARRDAILRADEGCDEIAEIHAGRV